MTLETLIRELEQANPVLSSSTRSVDDAWSKVRSTIIIPTPDRSPLRHRRTFALVGLAGLVLALIGVVVFQALPSPVSAPTSASATPFLKQAALTLRKVTPFSESSLVVPQPNQYVYAETEEPNGNIFKSWLSVTGAATALQRWTSGIPGEVPASGSVSNPPCTIAQASPTTCVSEAGYYPDMPTDPTALLAYLNSIGVVDTADPPSSDPAGWENSGIASAVSFLMQSAYLTPSQDAALFTLMAQTPGFTMVPNVADAIGRIGVGVEWNYEGDSGVLIFNPTTYAYLGIRTWPSAPDFSAPYHGDALIGVSIVNSIPSAQS